MNSDTPNSTPTPPAPAVGSENSAHMMIEACRRLRQANLRRYWSLKNAEQCDHVPTQAEHGWGIRFIKKYPNRCATCGIETRSPLDATMIVHDVDACVSPNHKASDCQKGRDEQPN